MSVRLVGRLIRLSNSYRSVWVISFCLSFVTFRCVRFHPSAEHAAEAAEFAAAYGSFWRMHDVLIENQEDLQDELLFGLAAKIG
jgi:hypothetical protein